MIQPLAERRHGSVAETFHFEFATADLSVGGHATLYLRPEVGQLWYWTAVVGRDRQLASVVETEIPLPETTLEFRTTGLWADHNCESPLEHWSVGLEAFAVGLDDPTEVFGAFRGDRVPLGFDLEWEATAPPTGTDDAYGVNAVVHGELLIGAEEIDLDAIGRWTHVVSDELTVARDAPTPSAHAGWSPARLGVTDVHRWLVEGPSWVERRSPS